MFVKGFEKQFRSSPCPSSLYMICSACHQASRCSPWRIVQHFSTEVNWAIACLHGSRTAATEHARIPSCWLRTSKIRMFATSNPQNRDASRCLGLRLAHLRSC